MERANRRSASTSLSFTVV